MYKYYKIVQSEEHMLYAKEIAVLYRILNKNNDGDAVKVSKIIKQYLIDNKIEYEQLYYNHYLYEHTQYQVLGFSTNLLISVDVSPACL